MIDGRLFRFAVMFSSSSSASANENTMWMPRFLAPGGAVFGALRHTSIGRAFDANRDPIAGIEERDFQKLFSRIANLAPAPVGLGDPWKKAAA